MTNILGYAAIALGGASCALLVWSQTAIANSFGRRQFERHVARIEHERDFLRLRFDARTAARAHGLCLVGLTMAAIAWKSLSLGFLVPVLGALPMIVLSIQREQRVVAINQQLDVWLLALSNALQASPSLGAALANSATLVAAPLSEELDHCLKEIELGAPLDRALLRVAERVDSNTLSAAVSTLLVARRTGGSLPATLKRTAAALREMERLEGVLRTKTAESKSQAWVLGAMPFLLCAVLHSMDPDWLPVLVSSFTGYVIVGSAIALWIGGIFTARKILEVDI